MILILVLPRFMFACWHFEEAAYTVVWPASRQALSTPLLLYMKDPTLLVNTSESDVPYEAPAREMFHTPYTRFV